MTNKIGYLAFPIIEAVEEDVWNACVICGLPKKHTCYQDMVGLPVEYNVKIRGNDGNGSTYWKGLHEKCWEINKTIATESMLDAANKLIAEAADEAKRLQDRIDELEKGESHGTNKIR